MDNFDPVNPDFWMLLSRQAWPYGEVETHGHQTAAGVVLRVTARQFTSDGTATACSVALTFIPGTKIQGESLATVHIH